jgi:hypothetical protein
MRSEWSGWTRVGVLIALFCVGGCVCCEKSHEGQRSFRGMKCMDLNGGTFSCEVALGGSRCLVFSPFCPTCREVVRRISASSRTLVLSAQSIPYLRYYQLRIPITVQIYKISAEELGLIGIRRVPCLLKIDVDGNVSRREYSVASILEELDAGAEVMSERQFAGNGSDEVLFGIPAWANRYRDSGGLSLRPLGAKWSRKIHLAQLSGWTIDKR